MYYCTTVLLYYCTLVYSIWCTTVLVYYTIWCTTVLVYFYLMYYCSGVLKCDVLLYWCTTIWCSTVRVYYYLVYTVLLYHYQGYLYAAARYGDVCNCGNTYGSLGNATCTSTDGCGTKGMPCQGDPSTMCGNHGCNMMISTAFLR